MQVQNNMKLKVQDGLLYACMSCSVYCDDGTAQTSSATILYLDVHVDIMYTPIIQ